MAENSLDTIGKVLNFECEVTFTPLCRSVCHPDEKVCPIFYKNCFEKVLQHSKVQYYA